MNTFSILYNKIIMEDYNSTMEFSRKRGYQVVDSFNGENWRIILFKSPSIDPHYDIAITTFENGFQTVDDQSKRPTKLEIRIILSAYRQIVNIIKNWYKTYGELCVGSYNVVKTLNYHEILNRNFNTTKINTVPPKEGFGQAWYFYIVGEK